MPPVSDLAERFHTSRQTVARALARLQDEGLVTIVPRWGTSRR